MPYLDIKGTGSMEKEMSIQSREGEINVIVVVTLVWKEEGETNMVQGRIGGIGSVWLLRICVYTYKLENRNATWDPLGAQGGCEVGPTWGAQLGSPMCSLL